MPGFPGESHGYLESHPGDAQLFEENEVNESQAKEPEAVPWYDSNPLPRSALKLTRFSSHKCAFCNEVHPSLREHLQHLKLHGYTCYKCGQSFTSHWNLNTHAEGTDHESYHCSECDARFSRVDVLKRHKIQHSPPPKKYSCTHCKKWRAPNGFARKDHLTQHQRNYHHIDKIESSTESGYMWRRSESLAFFTCCTHEGCPLFKPISAQSSRRSEALFASRGEYTKHMRQEHDETPFPCTKAGCKRVNGKGFFRKRDLMKHMKREHDISEEAETTAVEDAIGEGPFTHQ